MVDDAKKRGPGRPPGAKNKNPRQPKKEISVDVESDASIEVAKQNKSIVKHLSGSVKALFEQYATQNERPIETLKAVASTMKARHHVALLSEFKDYETKVQRAKDEYKELEETGCINAKTIQADRRPKRLKDLIDIINCKFYLSSQLTTLESELIKVYTEIERIESGKDTRNVNIFAILDGRENVEITQKLQDALFSPDKAILDPEDADFVEEEPVEDRKSIGDYKIPEEKEETHDD